MDKDKIIKSMNSNREHFFVNRPDKVAINMELVTKIIIDARTQKVKFFMDDKYLAVVHVNQFHRNDRDLKRLNDKFHLIDLDGKKVETKDEEKNRVYIRHNINYRKKDNIDSEVFVY